MTRFNYRPSAFTRLFGDGWRIGVPVGIRAPIVALGGVIVLVAGGYVVEAHRVDALDAQLDGMSERLRVANAENARVDALESSVVRLRSVRAAIAHARRDTRQTVTTIIRIGNALPEATWLTRVRSSVDGQWSIAGRSTHVESIGTTLADVASLETGSPPQLVSVNAIGTSERILDFVIAWKHE